MKKSVKRLLCSTLSVLMASTLVTEACLRFDDENASAQGVNASASEGASVSFKNVTGQFDTSSLMAENFNDKVLKTEEVAPKYETRTVMVTLTEKPLVSRAKKEPVNEYLETWDANRAVSAIEKEQRDFLSALKKKGISYKLERSYDTVLNGVAIEIDTKYVSQIKKMDGVKSVVITTAYSEPKTMENYSASGVVTNQTEVYATGIYDSSAYAKEYGEGTVVAVLDTGLDYTHRAFQRFESENVNVAWDKDFVLSKLNDPDFELSAEKRSGTLSVNEVYLSEKVPFAYDYADDDADVYPSYSNHGTHVAGIIGGYDTEGYTDKDGNPVNEVFKGVAPDAQLVICKVFTDDLDDKDLGGAVAEDIIAALDDCVKLGVDVINMSLGTSCGFTTTDDGDDEGEMLNEVYERISESGISLICAASNDYSAGYGGVYGTNLATNPDSGTVGSPSTFASALSVASINGQKANYMLANEGTTNEAYVFYEEARDINSKPFDFYKSLMEKYNTHEFEYVVVPGVGHASNYASIKKLFAEKNRIALVKRGDTSFKEKIEVAMEMGAIGIIVYNNVSGVIRMNLGEIEDPIPAVSATLNAGLALVNGAKDLIGKIKIDDSYQAGPFMSEFSSWGPTHDLRLKPEITAHGGEITSTVPGGYGEQSGTSMATPNMAGFMALVRSYIKNDLGITDAKELNRLAMQLTMSTAGTVYDQDGFPYSPRKQGAGVAKLENVIGGTKAYLWTDNAENDYRPKYELFDDPEREGEYEIKFNLTNFGGETLSFNLDYITMTETLSNDKLTVAEQAKLLKETSATWYVDGNPLSSEGDAVQVSVGANQTKEITVVLRLGEKDKDYIETSFKNGMYVEGFIKLNSESEGQCDLTLPYLGFYGDWDDAPMLDYSAFEVAENAQDASVKDEDKIKASVWETLPYNSYYNETYILPMGGYVYLLPENDEPMYVDEEHCSVSRYNEYYGEGNTENYLTSTQIKAVYAGLLRNARVVKYSLYNVETGEALITDEVLYRIGKAYTGGGAGVPANVEINLSPEAEGLVANGKYEMKFEFFKDEPEAGERASEENTYSFSFTVDYEAPVLEDVRVRFYNYKENDKEKQRVYLDVDVFDNHYAQAMMLCYPKTQILDGQEQVVLQLATDYPTPVRKANKNGTTTVSIDVTNIYDSYINSGNTMYIQVDDYAVNSCLYELNITEANKDLLPDGSEFSLAEGEDEITLDIYQTHKVSLVYADSYKGNADLSNFNWTSQNKGYVQVKNGEIVGLKSTKDCDGGYVKVLLTGKTGAPKEIKVRVTENVATGLPEIPSISLGVIKNSLEALQKAQGSVKVMAGKTIELGVEAEPWYHPMAHAMTQADYMEQKGIRLVWSSKKEQVATVDQNGVVQTLKKGVATISVNVEKKNAKGVWEQTIYGASITLNVQNEFTVSNYTLTDYNGVGGVVTIPDDMNIMYIGAEAFKDNDNITKIIIPASVVNINERAFYNCTALEEVYFVSEQHREDGDGNIINPQIDWSDLAMVYENAFTGCIKLRKIDLSNVKTITVAQDCFSGCVSLSEIVDMPSIGTMHHRAFAGTALTSVDLSGLHMSGKNVFEGCTSLTSIKTGKFTAIGAYMFKNCTALEEVITLATPKIGAYAFSGCKNLKGVVFQAPEGENLRFEIGANAFEFCGSNLAEFTVDFGDEVIGSIGERAFANSALKTLDFSAIQGLTVLGGDILSGTTVKNIILGDAFDFEKVELSGAPFKGMTVSVARNSTKYTEENGVIYNADKSKILFVNESVAGDFLVEYSVTEIGNYAFANANVTNITFHSNLNKIGEYAFYNSAIASVNFNGANLAEIPEGAFQKSALTAMTLGAGVKSVGAYAFAESAIQSFVSNGLTSLGSYAFQNCGVLVDVALNDDLKKMGNSVFQGCTSIETIALPSVQELGRDTFYGAKKLTSVSFGANATTTGSGTFQGTPLETVEFKGEMIEKIGGGTFYGCTRLRTITLPDSVTEIEERAFEGCTRLASINLDNVQIVGDQAFYRTGLTMLNLPSATYIGRMAFATQSRANENMLGQAQVAISLTQATSGNAKTAYTSVSMPMVEEIGDFAFLNSGLTTVNLPATVRKIGQGAFASSNALTNFTVAQGNTNFFVNDGVLYRYIDENTYEIVAYPTAKADADGKYEILEKTVRVEAFAFFELNEGGLNSVLLPYSINTIGDCAFYASGIMSYAFESIQAPALETVYRSDVEEQIESASNVAYYKGYYYCNFETYLFKFTHYVKEISNLTIQYPANGKGYDNHIYTLYFGTRIAGEVMMADETRDCVNFINEMPNADTIKAWMNWEVNEENKAKVVAFSKQLIDNRVYYNNALNSEEQAKFITEEMTEKLLAVETALREVKAKFSVPVSVQEIKVSADSTHKTDYKPGDTFDKTGLKITVIYDDYSTEEADEAEIRVLSGKINSYRNYVEVECRGIRLRVGIKIINETTSDSASDSTVDSDSVSGGQNEGKGGCNSVIGGATVGLTMLALGVAILRKKKEN